MNDVIRGNFEILSRTLKFFTFYFSKNVYFTSKSDKFQGISYNLNNCSDDAILIPLSYQQKHPKYAFSAFSTRA